MPTTIALRRARQDARQGKKPTTQAGEFIREEMHRLHEGDGNVRSRKQAIAIGLSEARRAGVKLGLPKKGTVSAAARRHAERDTAIATGKLVPSPNRSRGARKAAQTRRRLGA
jgi:Family of unknown function (DUF6496)